MRERSINRYGLFNAVAFSVLLIGCALTSLSQVPRYDWSTHVSSAFDDACEATAVSPDGDFYVGGFHLGAVDLDPGPAVLNGPSYGCYIQKLDSTGNLIWVYSITAPYTITSQMINDMEIAANGDLLVVGTFPAGFDFDPGPATLTFTPIGPRDMVLLRISSTGNLVYAQVIGSGNSELPLDMELDTQGNIYVVGSFELFMDIDPGPGTYNLSASSKDGFVAKYDSLGNPLWGIVIGGIAADFVNQVSVSDGGDFTVGGAFVGTTDFDPSPATFNMTAVGPQSAYLARYSATGQFRWARQLAGAKGNSLQLEKDSLGNIICAGAFFGSIDLDLGPSTLMAFDQGGGDIFLLKMDTLANRISSFSVGNSFGQYVRRMDIDGSDNVYVAVNSLGTVDWDPSSATYNVIATGHVEILAKYDSGGSLAWAQNFARSTASVAVRQMKVVRENEILVAAKYYGNLTMTPDQHPVPFSPAGGDDGFLLHLAPCVAKYATVIDTACSEPYIYNGITYSGAGVYNQHLYNTFGCDSFLTLVVSWAPLAAQIVPSTSVLTASPTGISYQWLDCMQGMQPIANATLQTYAPAQYGSYAVVINNGLCVDTSACQLFELVGIANPYSFSFDITPNPTAERIQFLPPAGMDGAMHCVLTDIAGRVVLRSDLPAVSTGTACSMELGALPSGTYLLHLHSGEMHWVAKVVKL